MTALITIGCIVAYVAIGAYVAFSVYDFRPCSDCRKPRVDHRFSCGFARYQRCPTLYPEHRDATCECGIGEASHETACECNLAAGFAGAFWPVAVIVAAVWVLRYGKKQPKRTRIGRAQRKARKVQERIEEMERELGLRP